MATGILTASEVLRKMGNVYGRAPQISNNKQDNQVAGALFEATFYRALFKKDPQSEQETNDGFDTKETREIHAMQMEELAQFLGSQGKLGFAKMCEQTPKLGPS